MASLIVPATYGWVLVEAAIIGVQLLMVGYSTMPMRKRLFTKAFFEKEFPGQFKGAGERLPELGYPDAGAGQFSQKLPTKDWMEFANAQRAHGNYVEGAAPMLTFLLISGLFFPRFSAACGALYIVGRALYTGGYKTKGSRGRMVGVLILNVGLAGVLGGALWGSFNFAGGLAGFKALF